MLKTAKKHKANFAAIKLEKSLKEQLPMWYHISATKQLRRLDNTILSKCLRKVHNVTTVADIAQAARHDAPIEAEGTGTRTVCQCDQCTADRSLGCKDPIRCRIAAGRLLGDIGLKWNPSDPSPNDRLTLTKSRKEANTKALDKNGEYVTFDPSVTERGGIAEAFRVFVDEDNIDNPPAIRARRGIVVESE
ncbi:uncharacterized protein C8Q71DRAFT_695173, partial [Rhodofomes roseus]